MSMIYTAGCRARQAVFRVLHGRRLEKQQVVEGTGAVFSVAQLLRSSRLTKPMVVAAGSEEPLRDRVLHALKESDLSWSVWELPQRTLTPQDADDLRMAWVREACDCFILLGDGETMDFGKISAALAAVRGRSFESLVGYNRIRRRLPPVIAIPTAAGSGAEALAWVSAPDGQGERRVVCDPALVPPFLLLDPELMEDVSRPELACASMDGICLAVEAYLSGAADDGVRAVAADALRDYLAALEPCWNSGGTPAQRGALMSASRMAGEAASAAGPGYARALVRAAGRITGRPAGELCAAVLPVVMEKYGNHAVERLALLAERSGAASGGTRAEDAGALVARLRQLAFRVGLPEAMNPLPPDTVTEIAARAAAEANGRYACPAVWTAAELAEVLRSACEPK